MQPVAEKGGGGNPATLHTELAIWLTSLILATKNP